MRIIKKGATSQVLYVEILDSASTTGGRKTGLAFNTASLVGSYVRNGAARTAITLATQTAAGAYSSGGFVEVDATNVPGIYRFDVPDAAFASGADSVVVTLKGAAGMVQVSEEVQLVAIDLQDAVRMGMTALPNANAEAAGGLYTRGTGAGQINQANNGNIDANTVRVSGTAQTAGDIMADTNDIQTRLPAALVGGRMDASVGAMAANVLTSTAINADAITAAKVAADVTTEIQTGLATSAALATVQADTDDIQSRLPAALVSGKMDSNLGLWRNSLPGPLVSGRVDSYEGAAGTDTINAAALAADAVAEIAAAVSVGSAPTAAQVADAVWDEANADHLGAGSTGAKLNSLSGASGSGAITHTVTVTSGGNPVDGALVWVTATSDPAGAVLASGFSDTLGHVTVFLDAGTYWQHAQRGGINFTSSSFVVA